MEPSIRILRKGPYAVTAGVPLRRATPIGTDQGEPIDWELGPDLDTGTEEEYHLCRCGRSEKRPFCDGACERAGFDGTPRANPAAPRRRVLVGDGVVVTDAPRLCATAGFCENRETHVWEMIAETEDPAVRERLIAMVERCPSGRLQHAASREAEPIEPDLPRAIGVVSDGPLWVTGRIPVYGIEGEAYEPRNRVTLCRCGGSGNKPLCDGSHREVGFRDTEG